METFLALGAGVQSTGLALLIANRDQRIMEILPEGGVRCAIFSDTQQETRSTYTHLDRLTAYCAVRGLEIHRATKGDILHPILHDDRFSSFPAFTDANQRNPAPLGRNCTRDYKVMVTARRIKDILGVPPRKRPSMEVGVIMGISRDEAQRMKWPTWVEGRRTPWMGKAPPRKKGESLYQQMLFGDEEEIKATQRAAQAAEWQTLLYPLLSLGERGWSRDDCAAYNADCGFEDVPRSACKWCPYHSNDEWHRLKLEEPVEFEEACQVDEAIRDIRDEPHSLEVGKSRGGCGRASTCTGASSP